MLYFVIVNANRKQQMKVFTFNPTTGRRGEQIADLVVPSSTRRTYDVACKFPAHGADAEWQVITEAKNLKGQAMSFDVPVCFCLGKWTAGTDTTWQWCVLMPAAK